MSTLARFGGGRILLHLFAMLGDRCVRFHLGGIMRELSRVATPLTWLTRVRARLLAALVLYLAEPIDSDGSATTRELQSLVPLLVRGDVLLSEGNTRLAALVKRVTRSSWSHVSMYVGPLEEASDPRCVVEADIAGGVRAIRLSELNALHLRVLRPTGVADMPRHQAADWVVSRIGCEYDLALALALCREMLQVPLLRRWSMSSAVANSASRFICCSLLANAFALVGYPIFPVQSRISPMAAADQTHLTPGDFERASVFEVVCGFPPTGS